VGWAMTETVDEMLEYIRSLARLIRVDLEKLPDTFGTRKLELLSMTNGILDRVMQIQNELPVELKEKK
jgi:hypothetical protein